MEITLKNFTVLTKHLKTSKKGNDYINFKCADTNSVEHLFYIPADKIDLVANFVTGDIININGSLGLVYKSYNTYNITVENIKKA